MSDKIYKLILWLCAVITIILMSVMLFIPTSETKIPKKEAADYNSMRSNELTNISYDDMNSISLEQAKKIASQEIPEPWLVLNDDNERTEMYNITFNESELKNLLEKEIGKYIGIKIDTLSIKGNGSIDISGSITKREVQSIMEKYGKLSGTMGLMMRVAPNNIDIDAALHLDVESDELVASAERISVMGIPISENMISKKITIDNVNEKIYEVLGDRRHDLKIDSINVEDGCIVIDCKSVVG